MLVLSFNFNFCRFAESVCLFVRWLGSGDTRVRVYDLFILFHLVHVFACAHVWCAPLFVSFEWIRVHALGMSLLYWHLCMLFSFLFLFVHATRCNQNHETLHFIITHFIGWDVGIRISWAHQFIIGCQPQCPFFNFISENHVEKLKILCFYVALEVNVHFFCEF
jgi:hypothetical protein